MRSTGTGPALRWAAGAEPGGAHGEGPSQKGWGPDWAARFQGMPWGQGFRPASLTCALPTPDSWQPPVMYSPRSSLTGSVGTSTSRSSTSERGSWGPLGREGGLSPSVSSWPLSPGDQGMSPELAGGPGDRVSGASLWHAWCLPPQVSAHSPHQPLPHDAKAQLPQGGPAGQGAVRQARPQL